MTDWFAAHAPMLVVLVPLMAAGLCMLFGGSRALAFYFAVAATAVSFVLSLSLALRTLDGTVLSYHIGGWAPPLGIEYRIDAANALVLLIVSLMALVVLPFARTSISKEIQERHHSLFLSCYLLCITGLLGVAATGDAFNVFVFLEISSLSTYVLVAMGADRDRRALSVAYDYLILGTIGATFFVIGLGFLYMATGTLNMVDMAQRIAEGTSNRTVRSGFAFIVVGMGLKLAMYPLHRWLPGAYTYAPSAVSAFLAATATKVALYVVLRFAYSVFSARQGFEQDVLTFIILPLAVVAMFAGSLIACFQLNTKRMLAYSSIAQIGYMLLGFSLLSVTGTSATMVHMFNHAITKGALFMAVGAIIYRTGTCMVPSLAGLGRQMPWTSAAIVVGGLSLIGVPGTVGFVSKWVLLQAAFERDLWFLALLIVASSIIAVVYVWRVVETLYLAPPLAERTVGEAPLSLLAPIWFLSAMSVWFGVDASFTMEIARTAAQTLFDGSFAAGREIILGVPGR